MYSVGSRYNTDTITLRPGRNGRRFPDAIFKCIFLTENVWIRSKMSLKIVPKGALNNIPALVQIMAWRRPGDKPLSEPMMVSLLTHICVARLQWVYKTLDTPREFLWIHKKNISSLRASYGVSLVSISLKIDGNYYNFGILKINPFQDAVKKETIVFAYWIFILTTGKSHYQCL